MQRNDWFFAPAPNLYIGKHEKLMPAPMGGGYRYATRVIHPGRRVKVPQVETQMAEAAPTWKELVIKIRKKIRA